jgi:hypothetical protein
MTMCTSLSLQDINSIAQIAALILAGAWAIYTFVEQEKHKRGLATINFKINRVGKILGKENPIAVIRAEVSLHNPGYRRIFLFPSPLVVHGRKIGTLKNGDAWKNHDLALSNENLIAARDCAFSSAEPVYLQLIFNEVFLEPNEKITRHFDFVISFSKYNFIEATVIAPYSSKAINKNFSCKWVDMKDPEKFHLKLKFYEKKTSEEVDREVLNLNYFNSTARASTAIFEGRSE